MVDGRCLAEPCGPKAAFDEGCSSPPLSLQPRLGEALEVEVRGVGRHKPTAGKLSSLSVLKTRVFGGTGGVANSLDH